MTVRIPAAALALLSLSLPAAPAAAEIIEYTLPGGAVVHFEGMVIRTSRGAVTIRNALGGDPLIFSSDQVEVYETEDTARALERDLGKSLRDNDLARAMALGQKVIEKGDTDGYAKLIADVLEVDPDYFPAKRVQKLLDRMDETIPANDDAEKELKELVPLSGLQLYRTPHFVILTDVKDDRETNRRDSRLQYRMDLLERVYKSFMLFYASRGAPVEHPPEPMRTVLFDQESDFKEYAKSLSSDLEMAAGFWDPASNITFFYNHATSETFDAIKDFVVDLDEQLDALQKRGARGKAFADLRRLQWAVAQLIELEQRNVDLEVVSHETAHQMAGSSGLLPKSVNIPRFVHEGLATFFETPKNAAWAGIGSVNDDRLEYYRVYEDSPLCDLDLIVGDQLFSAAFASGNLGLILAAYGEAWAFSHFLHNRHFDELMTYYRLLGDMPPDLLLTPDLLQEIFAKAFDKDLDAIELEWKSYMNDLKTDVEIARERSRKDDGDDGRGRR